MYETPRYRSSRSVKKLVKRFAVESYFSATGDVVKVVHSEKFHIEYFDGGSTSGNNFYMGTQNRSNLES